MDNLRKIDSIATKSALAFLFFSLLASFFASFVCFQSQTSRFRAEKEELCKKICSIVGDIMLSDGINIAYAQDFVFQNKGEELVRSDFIDSAADKRIFEQLFAERYPNKIFGVNVKFSELQSDVKKAFAVFKIEYFLDLFEKVKSDFGICGVYYFVPDEKDEMVFTVLNAERKEVVSDGKKYVSVFSKEKKGRAENEALWASWKNEKASGFVDTSADKKSIFAYEPLIVNGRKLGVVCANAEVGGEERNEILFSCARLFAEIFVILFVVGSVVIGFFKKLYLNKIVELDGIVNDYAFDKNVRNAKIIEDRTKGKNEIAFLSHSFANMIRELENYMTILSAKNIHNALDHEMSLKDALTGIRNKKAFDGAMQKMEKKVSEGYSDFGIAIISLSDIKLLNDTFGHEKGNIAIKKLCFIVCHVFEHSPVFRIGGDDFAAILEDSDYKNIKSLVADFNSQIAAGKNDENLSQWERLSASAGYALFDDLIDESVFDVLSRAQKDKNKKKKHLEKK